MPPGAFMGKFTFCSTQSAGGVFYLDLLPAPGVDPLASFISPTPVDWIAYDAGNSMVYLATPLPSPQYLYYDPASEWVFANASLAQATAFSLVAAGGSGAYLATVVSGTTLQASYSISKQFSGLVFDSTLSGVAFVRTTVTESVASATAAGSAAGYDFSYADLTNTSFAKLDCTKANFSGCLLDGVDFTGATLASARFVGCNLTVATWGTNVQAPGAFFASAVGTGLSFPSVAVPKGLQSAVFDKADFTGADFSKANFSGASLDSVYLYGANFSGANLGNANLSSINAGLSAGNGGVNLSSAYLVGATLSGAHLEGANLSHTQCFTATAGTLYLIDTNLASSNWEGVTFKNMSVFGANFTDAILIGCTFTDVLFLSSLSSSNPVSMCGAHLEGATFEGTTTLTGVNLAGAYIADDTDAAEDTNGVPLFATPLLAGDAASLNGSTLPFRFDGLFASYGYVLGSSATVTPASGVTNQWALAQEPVVRTLGAEIIGYNLMTDGMTLSVYASNVNVPEQAANPGPAAAVSFQVYSTVIDATFLDPTTVCPNGTTLAVNQLLGVPWERMLTAIRPPSVPLVVPPTSSNTATHG